MERRTLIIISLLLISILILAPACYKRTKKAAEEEKAASTNLTAQLELNKTCQLPLVKINGECCLDENNNTACDKYEITCGNGKCDAGENKCTCPKDCGQCETQPAGACQQFTCQNDSCVVQQSPNCCGDGTCLATESCSSCFQDCCVLSPGKDTLTSFETMAQKWDIVVGDEAPPKDVVISTDIETAMQRYLIKKLQKNLTVGTGVLASEAMPFFKIKDHIVLGNPCDNALARELMLKEIIANYNPANETNMSCQIFRPGESMIKFVPTSASTSALYIGGYSWRETEAAAQMLIQQADSNNTRYNLNGREFRIQGEKANARIVSVI